MEPPNKRLRQSPPANADEDDFVPLSFDDEDSKADRYGYNDTDVANGVDISAAPKGPRAMYSQRNARSDPRHAKDRPKSKHALDGHPNWLLIKTKFKRRFVYNPFTGESLWRIPQDLMSAVLHFEQAERLQQEKAANAKWAEDQLKEMRGRGSGSNAVPVGESARSRRRRSESLQREDEQAMLAEIAAEEERAEEEDVKEVVKNVEPLKPVMQKESGGYDSDSSYEEVEVTDSEGEEDEEREEKGTAEVNGADMQQDEGPVEFGEDDIAYQLAAMNSEPDDPDSNGEYDDYYEDEEQPLNNDEAATIFREMLSDHAISPFTPWDKVVSDESIILDDRWVSLPNTRTRKAVWEAWVKDTASQLKAQRAEAEKLDPKIPFLVFLAEHASPKLYWPEFKRKYRKEAIMSDRHLSDKERESLYREHVRRLKLPESTRKADLITLLKSVPLRDLNRDTDMDILPQQVRSNVHFISLPASSRDALVSKHIASLPPAPADNVAAGKDAASKDQTTDDAINRRREEALAKREREVDEQRRKAAKEERWAKKDLRDEERELKAAMAVGGAGLRTQLRDG